METLTFTYTKTNGSVSDRLLLVLTRPSDMYAGIDLSDIDPIEAAKFVAKYEDMYNDFLENVKTLQNQFDLKHSYRQFHADKMTDIVNI